MVLLGRKTNKLSIQNYVIFSWRENAPLFILNAVFI